MTLFKCTALYALSYKKWIPEGFLYELIGNAVITLKISFIDKQFDTEKEATDFFTIYCLDKGYVRAKE